MSERFPVMSYEGGLDAPPTSRFVTTNVFGW